MKADKKWNNADDAEAAVDKAPVGRYAADGAGDEGEWNHAGAGNHPELEYPFVTYGVDKWTDEGDGNDDMREGEPVGAIGHERVVSVRLRDCGVDAAKPGVECGFAVQWRRRAHLENSIEQSCLPFEGEGRDATEHKSNDEEHEPEPDLAGKTG